MRKIALFVIAALIISTRGYAAENKEEAQDSVFQKVSDVINGKYEVKTVPFKKITVFQSMANCIGGVR